MKEQDGLSRNERRANERAERKSRSKATTMEEAQSISAGLSLKRKVGLSLLFLFGVTVGCLLESVLRNSGDDRKIDLSIVGDEERIVRASRINSFGEILDMNSSELEEHDLAELNLWCGSGIDGKGDRVEVERYLKIFNGLVGMVKRETDRNWQRWMRNPREYQNSEAYYRMGMLITVVRQDFGARYDPTRISEPGKGMGNDAFYGDSKKVFLQGLLDGDKVGTCASMPVLYVALARRLGYSVYLVSTKGHLFCRWDDGQERINFEGTGEGIRTDPDSKYEKWPFVLTEEEKKQSTYLKNLTDAQMAGIFLDTRASCLVAKNRNAEALVAEAQAVRLCQKDDLTGLVESLAFGRLIPAEVFRLAGAPLGSESKQKVEHMSYDEVMEFNRANQQMIERNMRRIRADPSLPFSNTPTQPYSQLPPQR